MDVRSIDHGDVATRPSRSGTTGAPLRTGDPVQVRSRFEDRWVDGFSVAVSGTAGYQLRRASDGSILPAWFPPAMVRRLVD